MVEMNLDNHIRKLGNDLASASAHISFQLPLYINGASVRGMQLLAPRGFH
jgi:hypothetical protein